MKIINHLFIITVVELEKEVESYKIISGALTFKWSYRCKPAIKCSYQARFAVFDHNYFQEIILLQVASGGNILRKYSPFAS